MTVSLDVEHTIFLNDLESFHNNNKLNSQQNWDYNGQAFRWPETIYNPIHSRWHHWVKAKRTVLKNKTFFFVELYSMILSPRDQCMLVFFQPKNEKNNWPELGSLPLLFPKNVIATVIATYFPLKSHRYCYL